MHLIQNELTTFTYTLIGTIMVDDSLGLIDLICVDLNQFVRLVTDRWFVQPTVLQYKINVLFDCKPSSHVQERSFDCETIITNKQLIIENNNDKFSENHSLSVLICHHIIIHQYLVPPLIFIICITLITSDFISNDIC